jgi:lysophospholipase L1-like esterase
MLGLSRARSMRERPARPGWTAGFPPRTTSTVLWFVVLAAAAYLGSWWLGWASDDERPGDGGVVASLTRALLPSSPQADVAPLPAALSAGAGSSPIAPRPVTDQTIEDFTGRDLEMFYRALARTATGGDGALTRIVHYGDSMLASDAISHAVRRRLQERFGDGGHGFVLAGRPWPWYSHEGVRHYNSSGFLINRITANPLNDGCFGLGGVAFRSFQPGARFFVEPVGGGRVSRFEVYYMRRPDGGSLTLEAAGLPAQTISTASPTPGSGFHEVRVPDGAHRLTIVNAGGGEVRLFGVVVERDGPGVVYDSLGVNGFHASNFARFDRAHLAEQIAHRDPALIMVTLGTNESQNRDLDLERYGADFTNMLSMLRAGVPGAACLVVSPPDRAMPVGHGRLVSRPVVLEIVARQRQVARDSGCAFWNTFEAMGGEGSAAAWRRLQPALMGGDLTHPTPEGAEAIGGRLASALVSGYERFRSAAVADR